jgi:uncharacterized protein
LAHHAGPNRNVINLDNLTTRQIANQDPALFGQSIRLPVLIDEIQYAPQLLSSLKEIIDRQMCEPGDIWLTGSQNFEVMAGVRESLAGRVALINLFGLTDLEKNFSSNRLVDYFSHILETTFPKIFSLRDSDARALYLSSYVSTYIERDVRELMGIEKRREFEIFVKLCAYRTAQLVNYDSLAKDAGVSSATAKQWLSVLVDSFLVRIVHPWFSNQNKRLIKSPKLFFVDAGLCAHLSGWTTPEQAALGPMAGHLFETHVLSNLFMHLKHLTKTFSVYFWRTKDGDEIDCLLEMDGEVTAIEVKMGSVNRNELVDLNLLGIANLKAGFVVSLTGGTEPQPIKSGWSLLSPLGLLKQFS